MYFFFSKLNKFLNNLFPPLFFKKNNKSFYKAEISKHLIKKDEWNYNDPKLKNFYFLEKKIYFNNLYCDPYTGFYFNKSGRLVISEHIFKHYINIYHNFFLYFFINKKKIKKGVFFGGYFMENYCHFLFYIYVPILFLPKEYTLVFDSRLLNHKFFKDYLDTSLKDRKYILINKPTLFEEGLIYQKKYLGNKELNNINPELLKKNKKYNTIYLKRFSKNRNINLNNEKKIIFFLRKRFKNIKVITCHNLSLKKQIEVFANAKTIIGVHGADFANIIFGLKNIKRIIEFCPPAFFTGVYPRISKLYKIDHVQITGTQSGYNHEFSIELNDIKKII